MAVSLKYQSHTPMFVGNDPEIVTTKRTMARRYVVRSRVSARGDYCPYDYSVTNRAELVRRFNVESNNESFLHLDGVEPKIPPAN